MTRDPVSPAERAAAQRARDAADRKRIPVDLLARARQSIPEGAVADWCHGDNAHIGGRPVDAWRTGHRDAVIAALDARDAGAI